MGKLTKGEIADYKVNNIVRLCIYLFYIIAGLVIYAKSYLKYNVIINFLGVLIIITGCIYVYMSSKEKKLKLSNLDVLFGMLVAVDGLFMIMNPGSINNNLSFYLGLFFIISGCQKSVVGLKLIKTKDDAGVITLASAILVVSLGIVIMLNLFKNTSLTEIAGMFILFYGIIQLANTILLNNREKEIIKKN